MNVQLLFLLALVGPFCTFTHASPTSLPTDSDGGVTDGVPFIPSTTEVPKDDFTVVTGFPATEPEAAPKEVATEAATEAEPTIVPVTTEESVIETEAAATAAAVTPAPEDAETDPPAVETAAPTEQGGTEVQPVPTGASEAEKGTEVIIETNDENDGEGGLSSGQVAGIVIGGLLAVVIVSGVVIAAVRRMGKYSSAKNKKPTKKDSVMVSPLKKKTAKQQERPKFWKF